MWVIQIEFEETEKIRHLYSNKGANQYLSLFYVRTDGGILVCLYNYSYCGKSYNRTQLLILAMEYLKLKFIISKS